LIGVEIKLYAITSSPLPAGIEATLEGLYVTLQPVNVVEVVPVYVMMTSPMMSWIRILPDVGKPDVDATVVTKFVPNVISTVFDVVVDVEVVGAKSPEGCETPGELESEI
jgi:hypothetical protein